MKIVAQIGILVLVILGAAGSCFSAFASTGAAFATFSIPEPVAMMLAGTGLIALAGFGRKWRQI